MNLKPHHIQGPEIIQFIGLLLLIDLICKCFSPGAHTHVTVSLVAAFATGLFLFIWPMVCKARG